MHPLTFKTQDVVVMLEQRLSLNEIAQRLNVSRQAIWKRLKRENPELVSNYRGKRNRYWLTVDCAFCGKEYQKRYRIVNRTYEDYCGFDCYAAARANPNYFQWRHGTRLARTIVALLFDLHPEHIVHHRDGNNRNNDRANLMVFASQSDHLKYHHGKSHVVPLWDGALL